jgi:hypothetical protein
MKILSEALTTAEFAAKPTLSVPLLALYPFIAAYDANKKSKKKVLIVAGTHLSVNISNTLVK